MADKEYKTDFVIVKSESINDFVETCKGLRGRGYFPVHNFVVTGSDYFDDAEFMQQWERTTLLESIDNNPPNGGRAENEYLADIINKWGHMPEACLDMIKSAINPVEGE